MEQLYKKALESYFQMLEIHIDTKTKDIMFHEKTNEFYNVLFNVAHKIGERYIDLGGSLREDTLNEKKIRANKIIFDLRKELENYKENNKLSLGTDDLIGGLADELENIEGTSKAFL